MAILTASIARTISLLPRAIAIVVTLAAPVLAVPLIASNDYGNVVQAQKSKNSGAGFVLLMSLQRN